VNVKRSIRERWPDLFRHVVEVRLSRSRQDREELTAFLNAMRDAELFVVSGQGTLTDRSESHAIRLLETLGMAVRRAIPTAMFGQGLGPIADPKLAAQARAVLPGVSLIAVREDVAGPPLLTALGVDPARVVVTGDDAIEMSLGDPTREVGTGIGVNIRLTPGTGVDDTLSKKIRRAIHAFARDHEVPLIPLPIAFHAVARDPENIVRLLAGYDDLSDGGQSLTTPCQIIEQTKRCRIVVTVAYHAAVFALSQGIPVVCLGQTEYYIDKFVGLESLFGAGCQTVVLDQENLEEALVEAMARAWDSAEEVQLPLLRAAERQIEMGRNAYYRFGEIGGSTVIPAHKLLEPAIAEALSR
jgi:colanic acid/amylovoran biosynthesis protein